MQTFHCCEGENLVVFDRIKKKTKVWKVGRWFYYSIWLLPILCVVFTAWYLQKTEGHMVNVYEVFVLFVCYAILPYIFNLVFKAFLYRPVGELISYTDLILSFDEDYLAQTGIVKPAHYGALQGVAARIEMSYTNITKMVWNPILERLEIYGENVYLKKHFQICTGWEFKRINHFVTKDNVFRLYRMYPNFDAIVSTLEKLSGVKVEGYASGEFGADTKPGWMSSLYGAKAAGGDKTLLSELGDRGDTLGLHPAPVILDRIIASIAIAEDEKLECPICHEKTLIRNKYNDFGVCINCGCRRDV